MLRLSVSVSQAACKFVGYGVMIGCLCLVQKVYNGHHSPREKQSLHVSFGKPWVHFFGSHTLDLMLCFCWLLFRVLGWKGGSVCREAVILSNTLCGALYPLFCFLGPSPK